MQSRRACIAMLAAAALGACTKGTPAATREAVRNAASPPVQASGGHPYELLGTQVWDVPNPSSHRVYQVSVSVPVDYDQHPERRYPVLYVTDADYAFPVVRQIARRLNGDGPRIRDIILVGLSYAKGEDGMTSRRRDYTPTAGGTTDAPPGAVYGQGPAYQVYLTKQVIPFIAAHYRTDEASRYFLGHSYGGLLGAQILLSNPGLFRGYILGSPSLWYDHHAIFQAERSYAQTHSDLPATVYIYIGEYEQVRPGDPRYAGNENNMVTDVQTFTQALQDHRYASLQLKVQILNDEDHLSIAPRGATKGLEHLLSTPNVKASSH